MPGQEQRRNRCAEAQRDRPRVPGKNVLLVDDSIVRGTTSAQIIQMAREAGARKVYFASAAPPVRYPNVYGIDMPAATELVAHGRTEERSAPLIGADGLICGGAVFRRRTRQRLFALHQSHGQCLRTPAGGAGGR
jgi:amidophosphoribosyltransferase